VAAFFFWVRRPYIVTALGVVPPGVAVVASLLLLALADVVVQRLLHAD
jgi:hypothetical protein